MRAEASTRYDLFWTRRYRARLYLYERLKLIDLVDLLLVVIAITISAFGKPSPVYALLGVYLLVAVGKLGFMIKTRDTTNNLKASVITGLLNFINKELLNNSNRTRFTIFRVAPFRSDYIIPWVRFRRGGQGGRNEAFASRARFRQEEGITGRVWSEPPGTLAIQLIPEIPHGDRNLLRLLYESKYGVKPDTFDAISIHMSRVRCIISYVCLDADNQFLNLLSLDIAAPVNLVPVASGSDAMYLEFQENGKQITVDTQSLWRLVNTVGTVLLQFKHEQHKYERGIR